MLSRTSSVPVFFTGRRAGGPRGVPELRPGRRSCIRMAVAVQIGSLEVPGVSSPYSLCARESHQLSVASVARPFCKLLLFAPLLHTSSCSSVLPLPSSPGVGSAHPHARVWRFSLLGRCSPAAPRESLLFRLFFRCSRLVVATFGVPQRKQCFTPL